MCMHAGVLHMTQTEDVAALYTRADGLHADADKYKERREKKPTHEGLNSLCADGGVWAHAEGHVGLQLRRWMTVKQNKRKRK